MNLLWAVLMISGTMLLMLSSPETVLASFSKASQSALKLSLQMAGIYAIWLGILNIAGKCGLNAALSKLLKPVMKLLYGDASDEAKEFAALNLSANLLGLGNAATPMGIRAAAAMKDNTYALAMLMAVNSAGLQLVPTTVISLRAELGSTAAGSILIPCLAAGLVSCVCGVLLVAVFFQKKKSGKNASRKGESA